MEGSREVGGGRGQGNGEGRKGWSSEGRGWRRGRPYMEGSREVGGGEDRGMGKGERGGVVREGDGEEVGPIWREGEMAGREMEGRGAGDIL